MNNIIKIGLHRHGCICWWSPEKPGAHRAGKDMISDKISYGNISAGTLADIIIQDNFRVLTLHLLSNDRYQTISTA